MIGVKRHEEKSERAKRRASESSSTLRGVNQDAKDGRFNVSRATKITEAMVEIDKRLNYMY